MCERAGGNVTESFLFLKKAFFPMFSLCLIWESVLNVSPVISVLFFVGTDLIIFGSTNTKEVGQQT